QGRVARHALARSSTLLRLAPARRRGLAGGDSSDSRAFADCGDQSVCPPRAGTPGRGGTLDGHGATARRRVVPNQFGYILGYTIKNRNRGDSLLRSCFGPLEPISVEPTSGLEPETCC